MRKVEIPILTSLYPHFSQQGWREAFMGLGTELPPSLAPARNWAWGSSPCLQLLLKRALGPGMRAGTWCTPLCPRHGGDPRCPATAPASPGWGTRSTRCERGSPTSCCQHGAWLLPPNPAGSCAEPASTSAQRLTTQPWSMWGKTRSRASLALTWHRGPESESPPAPQASLATALLHFRGLQKRKLWLVTRRSWVGAPAYILHVAASPGSTDRMLLLCSLSTLNTVTQETLSFQAF